MPWPMASWRRMPEEPAARTTGISPAGGGLAHDAVEPVGRVELEPRAAGDVVAVLLAAPAVLGEERQEEERHRLAVLDDPARRVGDEDRARLVAEVHVHLPDARVGREGAGVQRGEDGELLVG